MDDVTEYLQEQLDNVFRHHPPTQDQTRRYETIRARARAFAEAYGQPVPEGERERREMNSRIEEALVSLQTTICDLCPESDERAYALEWLTGMLEVGADILYKLRSAVMWANSAIACNEPDANAAGGPAA